MIAQTTDKDQRSFYYINTAIVFMLMFGIGYLPTFGNVTPMGMKVLGVFIGVLYGWCTVSMIWPSLLGLVAIGSTGYCTITEAFSTGFDNSTPLVIISVYVLAAYCEESGLSTYIANWFVSRKIGEGRPWVFTILIFVAAYVMSALVSLYATIIILWGIFYKICDTIGVERKSRYAAMVIAGVVVTCTLTSSVFPFKPFSILMIGLLQKGTGASVDFLSWTVFHTVTSLAFVIAYLLFARFIVRPDVSAVKDAGKNFVHLRKQKMNSQQKQGFAVLLIFLLILFLPGFLPKTWALTAWLNNAGVLGGVTVCMILLSLVKTRDGKGIVNIPKLISKGVNWELIILLAATMPIADALEAEEVGILSTVVGWMTAAFSGLSPTVFLIVVITVFLIATQFAHNLILLIVFTPVLTKMGMSFGIEPVVVASLMFFCGQYGIFNTCCLGQCRPDFWQYRMAAYEAKLFLGWVHYADCFCYLNRHRHCVSQYDFLSY